MLRGISSAPTGLPRTEPTGQTGPHYASITFLRLDNRAQSISLIHLFNTHCVTCHEAEPSLFPSEATSHITLEELSNFTMHQFSICEMRTVMLTLWLDS